MCRWPKAQSVALLQAAWAAHAEDHAAADAALSRAASSDVAGEEVDSNWPLLMRAQLASSRGAMTEVGPPSSQSACPWLPRPCAACSALLARLAPCLSSDLSRAQHAACPCALGNQMCGSLTALAVSPSATSCAFPAVVLCLSLSPGMVMHVPPSLIRNPCLRSST